MTTTRELIEERIRQTTGQHTRWLRFDDDTAAWFNGSDFVCQMNRWDRKVTSAYGVEPDIIPATDSTGEGLITEWAPAHQLDDKTGQQRRQQSDNRV
jgi:hypothetical protein